LAHAERGGVCDTDGQRRTPMKLISEGPPSYRGSASLRWTTTKSACLSQPGNRLPTVLPPLPGIAQCVDGVGLGVELVGDRQEPAVLGVQQEDHPHGGG